MITIILSIIAITISVFTLIFYLFQEYRELFTLYWFAKYDVIYIPIINDLTQQPMDFIEMYQKEFHRNLGICEFKHQWIGYLNMIYYFQNLHEYVNNIDELSLKSIFISVNEHKYFVRIIITNQGKKAIKHRIKSIRKAV